MSVLGSIFRISVQFGNAKALYKRCGVIGRTVSYIGQLLLVALAAGGAWGVYKSMSMLGDSGVVIPILFLIVSVAIALGSALWVVLFVLAYVPVLVGEIRKHNAKKSSADATAAETTPASDEKTDDAPKMSKLADVVFIVLNLLTVPIAAVLAMVAIMYINV